MVANQPSPEDGNPFLSLSRTTGSSRILAVTVRLGLPATIFLSCSFLSALTTGLALVNHHLANDPIGQVGLINTSLLPFVLGAPVLHVLLTLCRRLEITRAELARLSSLDMLTGVLNRRSILAWAQAACEEKCAAGPGGPALSLALIDADAFKLVNDKFGHLAGDAVLRKLTSVIHKTLPPNCRFGRFGGEEFAIIMPGRDADTALALAEGLRAAVESDCQQVDEHAVMLTISVGVTTCVEGEPELESLLARADQALYAAKHAGRNQVRATPPDQNHAHGVNVIPI